MKTVMVNRISLVLVTLFCCHGLTDEIGSKWKNREIDENVDFAVFSVGTKLLPIDYLIPFFDPSIKMLDIPNKPLDHKFIINKSAAAPLILSETSTQIPDPNAKFSDVSYNSKLYNVLYILCTSPDYVTIRKHSTEIFDHVIKSSGPYVMAEKHSTGMIDTISTGVSNYTSYIITIKNQSMKIIDNMLNGVSKWACSLMIGLRSLDILQIISACMFIGVFVGILLFVAIRSNQLRNSTCEVIERPENILMYMV